MGSNGPPGNPHQAMPRDILWSAGLIFVLVPLMILAAWYESGRMDKAEKARVAANPWVWKIVERKESIGNATMFRTETCMVFATDGTAVQVWPADYLRAVPGKQFCAKKDDWK